jgi:hypothetical protein
MIQETLPPDADDLARKVRLAQSSDLLTKEEKAEIAYLHGFARILDAAVLLMLEDHGIH